MRANYLYAEGFQARVTKLLDTVSAVWVLFVSDAAAKGGLAMNVRSLGLDVVTTRTWRS